MGNNCQSDSTQLERLIRGSDNTLSDLYSLLSQKLSEYLQVSAVCCVGKCTKLKDLLDLLDEYIDSEDQYQDIIIEIIDKIIDKLLEDNPTVSIQFEAAYFNEKCIEVEVDLPLKDETLDFDISFQNHTCVLFEEPLPDFTYEATYADFVCSLDQGELFPYSYAATYLNHSCILTDGNYFYPEYSASFINFVCEKIPACDTFSTVLCTSSELCELSMTSEWLDYSCFIAEQDFDISFADHSCIKNMNYETLFQNHVCILMPEVYSTSFINFVCVLIEEIVTTTTTAIPTTEFSSMTWIAVANDGETRSGMYGEISYPEPAYVHFNGRTTFPYFQQLANSTNYNFPRNNQTIQVNVDHKGSQNCYINPLDFDLTIGNKLKYLISDTLYSESQINDIVALSTEISNTTQNGAALVCGEFKYTGSFLANVITGQPTHLYIIWDYRSTQVTTTTTTIPVTTTTSIVSTTTTTTEVTTTTTTSGVYPVKYGTLYNWYAATDVRNIAANGWHVSTFDDTSTLVNYINSAGNEGLFLKESGLTYWNYPNSSATNSLKLNLRGSGYRQSTGNFVDLKAAIIIGTPDIIFTNKWRTRTATYANTYFSASYSDFTYGLSIRLIKDSTTLTNGQTGTYTGNDGKTYRTICIGTQEWLADNLAETKYRNGDWIHGYDGGVYTPISNSAWNALTTEAMCFYNDDESNG